MTFFPPCPCRIILEDVLFLAHSRFYSFLTFLGTYSPQTHSIPGAISAWHSDPCSCFGCPQRQILGMIVKPSDYGRGRRGKLNQGERRKRPASERNHWKPANSPFAVRGLSSLARCPTWTQRWLASMIHSNESCHLPSKLVDHGENNR
jgi:hypothetical protein